MDTDNQQLERDIENALRARGLKQQMQQWEAERVQTEATQSLSSKSVEQPIWPKIRRTIYMLSAVAAIMVVVIMALPTSVWNSTFNKVYRWGMEQYAYYFGEPKGGSPVTYQYTITELMAIAESSVFQIAEDRAELEVLGGEDRIQDAAHQIVNGEYAMAQSTLVEVRENLQTDDELYQDKCEDIDYLEALCQLGQNHRTKAIKQLSAITDSNSKHSSTAAVLVEKIKRKK